MIVVAGSLSFDYIFNFPGKFKDHILPEKIHLLNLSFLTDKLNKNLGGTAGNISYNLSLLGEKALILAPAGKDFGPYQSFLKKAGIETKYIKRYKNDFTSNYFALVDQRDNQIGGFYAGAMAKADKLFLEKVKEPINLVVISPTKPEAMIKLAQEAQKKDLAYVFDPGMQLPRLSKIQLLKGIRGAEILIGNDYEISLIRKKSNLSKEQLLGKVKILITTLAEKGSLIETQKKKIKIKAAKAKNVSDPVGAGDAYRAGFAAGYLRGLDLGTCGQMGAVTAVYTVEKYGTMTHKFTKGQFEKRYYRNFYDKITL
jgi:adenosine kinase